VLATDGACYDAVRTRVAISMLNDIPLHQYQIQNLTALNIATNLTTLPSSEAYNPQSYGFYFPPETVCQPTSTGLPYINCTGGPNEFSPPDKYTQLAKQINTRIIQVKNSARYTELLKKWFAFRAPVVDPPPVPVGISVAIAVVPIILLLIFLGVWRWCFSRNKVPVTNPTDDPELESAIQNLDTSRLQATDSFGLLVRATDMQLQLMKWIYLQNSKDHYYTDHVVSVDVIKTELLKQRQFLYSRLTAKQRAGGSAPPMPTQSDGVSPSHHDA